MNTSEIQFATDLAHPDWSLSVPQEAKKVIRDLLAERQTLLATGWWEGVNDQWKTRPIGTRLLETENPFRAQGVTR